MERQATQRTTETPSCQQIGRAFISAMFVLSEERIQSKSMDRARERALTLTALSARCAVEAFLELVAEDTTT